MELGDDVQLQLLEQLMQKRTEPVLVVSAQARALESPICCLDHAVHPTIPALGIGRERDVVSRRAIILHLQSEIGRHQTISSIGYQRRQFSRALRAVMQIAYDM